MKDILTEEQLIEYVKPYLNAKGFKKKNNRWIKESQEFTISFLIQGSSFSKENYYIRPGIFINALMPSKQYYGNWMCEIVPTTPERIMSEFEDWSKEWTDKSLIKERLNSFIEWEKRNPLEKRRENMVDYEADPVPAQEFFMIDSNAKQFVLENF